MLSFMFSSVSDVLGVEDMCQRIMCQDLTASLLASRFDCSYRNRFDTPGR